MVADGRGVGVKNRENLPTSLMDGPNVKRPEEEEQLQQSNSMDLGVS